MDDIQESVSKAEAAVAETHSRFGEDHLELSYKLDELAAALRAAGRLLEAANASAKAKAIRSRHFAKESEKQEEKFGEASVENQGISATAWMWKLYRAAIIAAAGLLVLSTVMKSSQPGWQLARELVGSTAAAAVLQLALFPIKSIPRILKFIIIAVGTSLIWMLVSAV